MNRSRNLVSAWDHGTGEWCGSLGKDLIRTGFVIKRGVLNHQQVSLLLRYHEKWHPASASGCAIHTFNGIRGMQVYIHPDYPEKDPFRRPRYGVQSIGENNKDLKEWQGILETLRVAAGRKDWPMDVDALCSWPGSTPQKNHQDGTFSLLASTVALESNTECTVFGNYWGSNIMSLLPQERTDWIVDKFKHCMDDKNMHKMPMLYAGDVVFFHSAHIHRAPSKSTRATRNAQPRRTFFFGFDSDSKTCESDVVTTETCRAMWGRLVPDSNVNLEDRNQWVQKQRRKRRREAIRMLQEERTR